MASGLLGRKVGMTQIFDEGGNVVPVTVIQAGPCHVLQVRTKDRDGYEAIQIGFGDMPRRLASRSVRGHVAKLDSKRSKARGKAGVEVVSKADCEPQRFVRELCRNRRLSLLPLRNHRGLKEAQIVGQLASTIQEQQE